MPQAAAGSAAEVCCPAADMRPTPFLCNVCGTRNRLPRWRLTREDGHCAQCQCYGRLRSMMYAVTARFSPDEAVLSRMSRGTLRGLGCSDWGYAGYLAEKFDYVNTFYDRDPQLDLCDVDWKRWPAGSFDFITCTDVLEHVEPPVERTFENLRRLLRPGGAAILTVPILPATAAAEHFPRLHDWRIEGQGQSRPGEPPPRRRGRTVRRSLFPRRRGDHPRVPRFSRQGLLETIRRAGLRAAAIHQTPVEAHAVPLGPSNFVLVAEREV